MGRPAARATVLLCMRTRSDNMTLRKRGQGKNPLQGDVRGGGTYQEWKMGT